MVWRVILIILMIFEVINDAWPIVEQAYSSKKYYNVTFDVTN